MTDDYQPRGMAAQEILRRMESDGGGVAVKIDAWPKPEQIVPALAAAPYPIEALPDVVRDAVQEVRGFLQAPLSMVATSALMTMSLAAQGIADVERAEGLRGPSSLFAITVAESGERKSACDKFFAQPLRDFEQARIDEHTEQSKDFEAEMAAWSARMEALTAGLRKEKGKAPSADSVAELAEVQRAKPEAPRLPQMFYEDTTPEAIAWGLAKKWPSAAIMAAEGGMILGGHGMSKETLVRNLALLNVLWDGASVTIDRRTKESFRVAGARLTVGIQVQSGLLLDFVQGTRGLARSSGFLARFLIAWPESTQGYRDFCEPPPGFPALSAYHARLRALLERQGTLDEYGRLTPRVLPLDSAAKQSWVAWHDNVEHSMRPTREMADLKDVAAKAADNLARLAAVLAVFEDPTTSVVAERHVCAGAAILNWHLREARRFFGAVTPPEDVADALALDGWLIETARLQGGRVKKLDARQRGPHAVRERERFTLALAILEDAARLRLVREGRTWWIEIHPSLLDPVSH
jgi:putative DNA primase/helicase